MSDLPPPSARQPVPASAALRRQRTDRLRAVAGRRRYGRQRRLLDPLRRRPRRRHPPGDPDQHHHRRRSTRRTPANVVGIVIGLLYYGYLEGGATGQTLGKRLCGIAVVDQTTWQPGIGVGRGIGRYFARWISAIPCGLGYFWMLWDDQKQCWHDKIVSTRVVKL